MTKTLALKKIMRLNIELEKVEGFSAMMIVDDMKIVLQEYSDQQNKALIKEVEGLKEKLMQSSIDYDVMEIANESLHKLLEELKQIKRLKAMFTGKNKEDFAIWFCRIVREYTTPNEIMNFKDSEMRRFYEWKFSMQQGVYLEYLDSVGMVVDCFKEECLSNEIGNFFWCVGDNDEGYEPTRQGALTEAFKKADELINNNS